MSRTATAIGSHCLRPVHAGRFLGIGLISAALLAAVQTVPAADQRHAAQSAKSRTMTPLTVDEIPSGDDSGSLRWPNFPPEDRTSSSPASFESSGGGASKTLLEIPRLSGSHNREVESLAAAPLSMTFEGLNQTSAGGYSAEPQIAVGSSNIIEWTESAILVTNKTGGSSTSSKLSSFFNSSLTFNKPVGFWDHNAKRFVFFCVAISYTNNQYDGLLWVCVSRTATPTATPSSWYIWTYYTDDDVKSQNAYAYYPRTGYDSKNFYLTLRNSILNATTKTQLWVFQKSAALSGAIPYVIEYTDVRLPDGSVPYRLQPCHTLSSASVEYLVNAQSSGGSNLTVFSVNPSSLSLSTGRNVPVGTWSVPPRAPQYGTSETLTTGSGEIQNAVYNNGSIYTSQCAKIGSFPCAAVYTSIRTSDFVVTSDVAYGNTTQYFYAPAVMKAGNGGMASVMTYSESGAYPGSIYATGSSPLYFDWGWLMTGQAAITGGAQYQGIALDPSNTSQVWMAGMYGQSTNVWGTRIGAVKLPAAGGVLNTLIQPYVDAAQLLRDAVTNTAYELPLIGKTLRNSVAW